MLNKGLFKHAKVTYSLLLLPLAFQVLLVTFCPNLFKAVILYSLFQLFAIIIPSYIAGALFLKNYQKTILERIFIGYPVIMVLLVALDLFSGIVSPKVTITLLVLFSWVSLYLERTRKTPVYGDIFNRNTYFFIFSYFIVCIAFFLSYTSNHIFSLHENIYIHEESYWNLGNTWSYLEWGMPVKDIRAVGLYLPPYHCFQNIYHAIIYKTIGVSPDQTLLLIEPYFFLFYFIGIVNYLSSLFKLNPLSTFVITVCVFFSSTHISYYNMNYHIFKTPVSFFISIPVFILFFYTLFAISKSNESPPVLYLLCLFIYLGANKIILIPICFASFLIFAIVRLIRTRELNKSILILFILFIVCSLLLKLTIYRSNDSITETYQNYSSLVKPANNLSDYFKIAKNNIINLLSHWSIIIMLMLLITLKSFRKYMLENLESYVLLLFSISFIVVLSIVLSFGGSNIYYRYYIQIIQFILGALSLHFILSNLKGIYKKIGISVFFLLVTLGIYYGINSLLLKRTTDNKAELCVNKDEIEAINWLKTYTNPNDIIAHDFRNIDFTNLENESVICQMFWSGLSGKTFFLDGSEFIVGFDKYKPLVMSRSQILRRILHTLDTNEQQLLLSRTTISYIISSKRFGSTLVENINLKKVYTNNSVEIYKVIKQ